MECGSISFHAATAGVVLVAGLFTGSAPRPIRYGSACRLISQALCTTLGEKSCALCALPPMRRTPRWRRGRKVEYKSYDTEAKPDLARRQSEARLEGYPILTGLIASGRRPRHRAAHGALGLDLRPRPSTKRMS